VNPFRTASGGCIDRAKPLRFSFDGVALTGFAGDTLASALLANGIHLVGRSFKYHRPRGILSAGPEEPNALVTVDRGGGRETPNVRATQLELYQGLAAVSQNRWPSLRFDLGSAADRLAPLIPAGFYYKTFMWPPSFWARLYEPAIRASAGLGRAPASADPDRYLNRYAHCDVLVVGGGPAGLAAARAAAETGARVILCDERAELGGSLLDRRDATIEDKVGANWLAETVEALRRVEVRLLTRTTAFGFFADNFLGLTERLTDHIAEPDPRAPRERLWQVRAKEVVLATGAIERPLAFVDNDRPGIMLAGAVGTYLNRYGVKAGTRAVVATADDDAYRVALDLLGAEVTLAAIADLRPDPDGELVSAARAAGIPVLANTRVCGTVGRRRVSAADLGRIDGEGCIRGERVACDLVLMSGGWTPSVHLFSQSRGRLRYDETLGAFVPGASVQRERSAGACRGTWGLASAVSDGYAAGGEAGRSALGPRRRAPEPERHGSSPGNGAAAAVPHRPLTDPRAADFIGVERGRAFVDFQNDVTTKDIRLALREGFRSIEHVKRYTTAGMATDQGKTSNMNALAVAAGAQRRPLPEVGLTTFRMPYTPVSFGTLAGTARGDLFEPVRTTPIHDWAVGRGAVFEDAGQWKRARYFPQAGEDMHAAVARECRTVRGAVGVFDASTLGKIEVVGPGAAEFLDRLYTNPLARLAPGRCRYGLLLSEAGFVLDDGVVARLAADRFHVTTTTGGAAAVLHHMEDYLQTEFTDLQVWLTSVTEQWSVIAVQGPKAREVIAGLADGIDIAPAAMPHMSVRTGRVAGVPARLFRVSFTGELGFEINVPSGEGRAVWEAVLDAGREHDIAPYGTEAMHVLRAEKGYIIAGQETDGTVIPSDLGLDWAIGKTKADFVGKRSLARPDMRDPDRKQLVGLLTDDPHLIIEEGAQVVAESAATTPTRTLGHVTSAYRSATLDRSIALALIAGGAGRRGERLRIPMPDRDIPVTVVDPIFYDPTGERLNA
jgi:sarcosine oxidase subunit alpha